MEIKTTHHDFTHESNAELIILSDSHGTIHEAILGMIEPHHIVLHAGDIMDAEILVEIRKRAQAVVAVQGNNDVPGRSQPHQSELLAALPEVAYLSFEGGTIAMEHGHRILDFDNYHGVLRAKYANARLIVFGHTHIEAMDNLQTPWVVNPGASGSTRNHGGPSCLTLSMNPEGWQIARCKFANS